MTFAIYTHPGCLTHDTGPMHPECADRLRVILRALKEAPFAKELSFLDAPLATKAQLLRAHEAFYIHAIEESAPISRHIFLDADTLMSPGTLDAALRAAGAGCLAVDAVMEGTYQHAFCAIRPPGHHATKNQAMGFCIFNNIAIAAFHALELHGLKRVAIVDFDVHHGNGTEDIIESDPRILYVSTHQSPLFPGTGKVSENQDNHILNLPLPSGTDSQHYRTVFSSSVLPALEAFAPEALLISAGFDSHQDDPLAGMMLTEADYYWIGEQLRMVAAQYCHGRAISFLEGGYNLHVLGASVTEYVRGIGGINSV